MADVFAGCTLQRLPHPRGAVALPFFEYAPRPPLPTFATLARYRKQFTSRVPKIALVAPRGSWQTPRGPMRPGPEVDAGIEWLNRVADILGAFAIVLATGAELTTGERDQELLRSFAERLKADGRQIVVAPRGLWEPEQAVPFALKSGTLYGFDPMEHDAPPGDFLYARVRPMGARPRLTEGALAQIAERIAHSGAEQSYVCVESERSMADAKRLTVALNEGLEAAALLSEAEADEDLDSEEEDSEEDQGFEEEEDGEEEDQDFDGGEEED